MELKQIKSKLKSICEQKSYVFKLEQNLIRQSRTQHEQYEYVITISDRKENIIISVSRTGKVEAFAAALESLLAELDMEYNGNLR